jgi:hypothetical protein
MQHARIVIVGLTLAIAACASHGVPPAAPAALPGAPWRYEVVAGEGARELTVDAWLPPGSMGELVVRRGAERFVRDVEMLDERGAWRGVARSVDSFVEPSCTTRGCRVRYRFLLRDAADALDDPDLAKAWGDVLEASPAMWLLHPLFAPVGKRMRVHVAVPAGLAFATGVFPADDGAESTYEADASNAGVLPYAAFGALRSRRAALSPGVAIDIAIAEGAGFAVDADAIVHWVTSSADAVARYFGCFPVERALVLVVPVDADDVRHGETMGDGGATIIAEVGRRADTRALERDWVMPHEMVHLGFPSVARQHHWMEEGVAVYVQPIARARAGAIAPEDVWREFARDMPKGEPHARDRGLDGTSTWGRTYWGGAMFCLLADIEIRRRTQNRASFDDALRGILGRGGSVAVVWDFDRALAAGDDAVGVPVLRELHARLGARAAPVDLGRLFRDLGVVAKGGSVTFDDGAPLADIRRAITAPSAPLASVASCRAAPPPVLARNAYERPRMRR